MSVHSVTEVKMNGIICALTKEAQLLKQAMTDYKTQIIAGIEFTSGRLCEQDAVIAVCGVGKVFAAMCTQAMILNFNPSLIINTGVGGTLTNALHCGDILIADAVLQHDMDTSPLGDPKGLISGINKIRFECEKNSAIKIAQIADALNFTYKSGTVASGDKFVADNKTKEFIVSEFQADVCDMESGAIGQVCYVNKTPFVIVRAISDEADGSAHTDYPTFMHKAADNAATIIKEFLGEL